MKMSHKELIALENLIDCTEHYCMIGHIRDEFGDSDMIIAEHSISLMKDFLNKVKKKQKKA